MVLGILIPALTVVGLVFVVRWMIRTLKKTTKDAKVANGKSSNLFAEIIWMALIVATFAILIAMLIAKIVE